jgi:hypothetical protein
MSFVDATYGDLELSNLIPPGEYTLQVFDATLNERGDVVIQATVLEAGTNRRFRFPANKDWSGRTFFRFLRACGVTGAPEDTVSVLLERLKELRPEVRARIEHTVGDNGRKYDNVSLFSFQPVNRAGEAV